MCRCCCKSRCPSCLRYSCDHTVYECQCAVVVGNPAAVAYGLPPVIVKAISSTGNSTVPPVMESTLLCCSRQLSSRQFLGVDRNTFAYFSCVPFRVIVLSASVESKVIVSPACAADRFTQGSWGQPASQEVGSSVVFTTQATASVGDRSEPNSTVCSAPSGHNGESVCRSGFHAKFTVGHYQLLR